jgi:hypothetical protein
MESPSSEKFMKEPVGIMPAVEPLWLKLFGQGSTGFLLSMTPGTSSSTARHANTSPPSLTRSRPSCTLYPSPSLSRNGASIRWDLCPSHLEEVTHTCWSRWTNSPNGSKLSQSPTKKQPQQSNSSSPSSTGTGYRTASSPTMAPTSPQASFRSLPKTSASRSSTLRSHIPSPTAKSKKPMGSYAWA